MRCTECKNYTRYNLSDTSLSYAFLGTVPIINLAYFSCRAATYFHKFSSFIPFSRFFYYCDYHKTTLVFNNNVQNPWKNTEANCWRHTEKIFNKIYINLCAFLPKIQLNLPTHVLGDEYLSVKLQTEQITKFARGYSTLLGNIFRHPRSIFFAYKNVWGWKCSKILGFQNFTWTLPVSWEFHVSYFTKY